MTTKLMKLLAVALCLAATGARAAPAATADEAAKSTLSQLSGLGAKGLRTVGMPSAADAKRSGLGAPLPVFLVGADALQTYDGRKSDREMLIDLQFALYPVLVNGEVTSSLGVGKAADGWETREISSPELARVLVQMRASAMASEKRDARAYFVVRVPALQMVFLAQGAGDELTLRSVSDLPEIGLAANAPVAGRELFAKLAPVAQQPHGLQREEAPDAK